MSASAAVLAGLMTQPLMAQSTIAVPDGTNLNNFTPVAGDVWNLDGNAFLSDGVSANFNKAIPALLTINGAANGSTITLNDGAEHYGSFNNLLPGLTTLNLSKVTFTGGLSGNGGVFGFSTDLTINGNATFANNATNGFGGVILAQNLTFNGDALFQNNRATDSGGAVDAFSATFNGSVRMIGNTATGVDPGTGNGGTIETLNFILNSDNGPSLFERNSAVGVGGAIWALGDVTLNASGGDITFTGNRHQGGAVANAIFLDNSMPSIVTFNAAAGRTITFFDPIISNTDDVHATVVKTGDGMVSFDGINYSQTADLWSSVYANTEVQAGTFEVANGAIYGAMNADDPTPLAPTSFTSAAGSTVQGGGFGTIRADIVTLNGDLNIAGRQGSAGTRSTFQIVSNNLTFGGGTIVFNTLLNDGTVQNTDLLILNLNGSATSGQAFIQVNSLGAVARSTVGNGIKLVQTVSGTTAGAFVLAGRVGGAGGSEYKLFYGGDAASGGDPNDQNWYLRNTFIPAPTPDNPSPQPVPIIRPEVAVDMTILPLALEYGYAMLSTLHDRGGETWLKPSGPVYEERVVRCKDASNNNRCVVRTPVAGTYGDQTKWASSGWARLIGERGFRDNDNFSKSGADYNYTFGGIQAGLDIFGREQRDGTLDKAGIYVGYGQIASDIKGAFGEKAGSVDMDAYTVGGYWSHFSPVGWYSDAVVQGTWYETDAKSIHGEQIKPNGFGIIASLEGGYAFKLGNNWTLEPQAQLAYQSTSFSSTRDQFGFVSFDDGESLRGRLGVRLAKAWNMGDTQKPRQITTWIRVNIWHEFLGGTQTSFGSVDGQSMVPFTSSFRGTWGEIGAGVSGQVTETTSLFANGGYNCSLDNKGRDAWNGRLGMTVKW